LVNCKSFGVPNLKFWTDSASNTRPHPEEEPPKRFGEPPKRLEESPKRFEQPPKRFEEPPPRERRRRKHRNKIFQRDENNDLREKERDKQADFNLEDK